MGLWDWRKKKEEKKDLKKKKRIPPTEAVLRGQFTASAQSQQRLRDLDREGGELQKSLGTLELDYLSKKNAIVTQFEQNRQDYQTAIADTGDEVGADFSNPAEPWNFDFKTMTFTRLPAPEQSPTPPKK